MHYSPQGAYGFPTLQISQISSSPSPSSIATVNTNYQSFSSDDYYFTADSDANSDDRGLNFDALGPNFSNRIKCNHPETHSLKLPTSREYKYPCSACGNPCINNKHDCISCNICDEWTHLKCTDLSIEQFNILVSSDDTGEPFYCNKCLFGTHITSNISQRTQTDVSAIINSYDIYEHCPNSVFRGRENLTNTSDYLTINDINHLDTALCSDHLFLNGHVQKPLV